ncbi:chaperone protein [Stylonychia lemnae]|uniref:Chaperone protein n=1 Tax=Stylonychia lemnae TaxID=5949 RepID=A0A078AK26_STYLE|nr:chaperone protein [Stylonychia lemnae]|eukprot:CDW82524.1 chaperone protein [Stylonychia lemnae]
MMLQKYLMQSKASLYAYSRMGFAKNITLTPQEKDYYTILGIPTSSTAEQIKESYRKLAKKYHPDARASESEAERDPNPDKFRDVNEAYAVLSQSESRVNYDLQRKKNPDNFKAMSEFEYILEKRVDLRDKTGHVPPAERPSRGSYAEERLHQLKVEREKYNVNYLGYYKGGVPQKDAGPLRSKSIGNPHEFHSPQIHNYLEFNHQDTAFVSSEDAIKFKHWMGSDIVDFQRSRPYYPMHYDRNMDFLRDRSYWLGFILLVMGGSYAKLKYSQESNRWFQWIRKEELNTIPAHHLSHRGGVLFEKQFVGFEKYHQNNESLMNWYKKAYPLQFQEAHATE